MPNNFREISGSDIQRIISLRRNCYTHRKISKILGVDYKNYKNMISTLKSLGIYQFVYKESNKNIKH